MIAKGSEDFFKYWTKRLEQDLTPFIDPGTSLAIRAKNRSVHAAWYRRTKKQDVEFTLSLEDGVTAIVEKQKMSYRSFLASPAMADLLSLAKMTLQAQKPQPFLETKARRIEQQELSAPALTVLQGALTEESNDATLVIMVTGEAGTGKTSVLKQLVRQQSDSYVRGQSQSLYLYVNAQGRALARFNEALATELDELRAQLTFHEVAPLVRCGLLVPIVDGFDELLGVGGYDDAFSSLSSFIEELDGNGRLVASARSTYYEQEFVARANKSSSLGSQVWRQIPVEILEWTQSDRNNYVELRCAGFTPLQSKKIHEIVEDAFQGDNKALGTKPFFVSKTVDLAFVGTRILKSGDLLEQLVNNYIERERNEKLLDRKGGPMLSNGQLRTLLIELAEEMWNQETRELDQRSAREVAEYVLATFGLNENARRIITERVTALAFFMVGERQSNVAFEHEVFFSYFLAHRIVEGLVSEGALGVLLGRSTLPLDSARITARILRQDGRLEHLSEVLKPLRSVGVSLSVRLSQIQENAGVLVVALLKAACTGDVVVEDLDIGDIVVPGLDMSGISVKKSKFTNVVFRRANFVDARFVECAADGTTFIEILVDPQTTRLEMEGVEIERQVVGLRIFGAANQQAIFDPQAIRTYLRKIGLVTGTETEIKGREIPARVISVIERFGRAYLRANPICVSDDTLTQIFEDTNWKTIQDLLVKNGVVTPELRPTKGHRPKLFLRRQVLTEELLAGINRDAPTADSVRKFWDQLEARFAKKSASAVS